MSCTECGRKGGCDAHKGAMFAALDEALARLYPTRRWGELDEAAAFAGGLAPGEGEALAAALAGRLKAATLFRPGEPDETCDYVYILCVGRPPGLIELREGALACEDAAALNVAYEAGAVETAWGRFYDKLPWPKRDRKKAEEHLRHAIEINPYALRARVYMASCLLDADRPQEAKRLLDEVTTAPVGRYDAPEERRAKALAIGVLSSVDAKLR